MRNLFGLLVGIALGMTFRGTRRQHANHESVVGLDEAKLDALLAHATKPFWRRFGFWVSVGVTVVIAVVTAFISFRIGASQAERQLEETRLELAQKTELSAKIEYLHVVLGFRTLITPAELQGFPIVILLRKHLLQGFHMNTVIVPIPSNYIEDRPQAWAFHFLSKVTDYSKPTRPSEERDWGLISNVTTPTAELPLPVSHYASALGPLSVRDLEDAHFQVTLPENLAKKINRIDLVVNSDYGFGRRFEVLSVALSDPDWRSLDINPTTSFSRSTLFRLKDTTHVVKMAEPIEQGRHWYINLKNAEWGTHNAIPDLDVLREAYR